jgi:opacity protein-like surface antigen
MFRKVLATIAIFASSLSTTYAGSFYIGPGAEWESVSINSNHYQGVGPRIVAGYGEWVTYSFFMAGEIAGTPRSIVINNEPKNGKSIKMKYSYSASVIPGFPMDETLMIYARLGYQYSRFDKQDVDKGGFLAGVGLDTNLTPCWDLRFEYDYTKYGNINSTGKPRENAFILDAIYRFYTL